MPRTKLNVHADAKKKTTYDANANVNVCPWDKQHAIGKRTEGAKVSLPEYSIVPRIDEEVMMKLTRQFLI